MTYANQNSAYQLMKTSQPLNIIPGIDTTAMQQKIKRYNITLRDHVQLLGYRGQIELIGRDLGLHGVVFNAPDGGLLKSLRKVKKAFLMCSLMI